MGAGACLSPARPAAPTRGHGPGPSGGLAGLICMKPHSRPICKGAIKRGGRGEPRISISAAIWREERARPHKGRRARGEASVPPH